MLRDSGKFIVFEGIDGVGTTSQSKLLSEKLNGWWTKEPSNNPIGKVTRELLKDTSYPADRTAMCLLFVADRLQHTSEEILPKLRNGETVICDRYLWSTLAYQRVYFDQPWLTEVHKYDYINLPDLTILLDAPVNVAEQRRKNRKNVERYDDQEIQKRVRENYLNLARQFPDRCVTIDASKDFDEVSEEIYQVVFRRLFENEITNGRLGGGSGS